MLGGRDFVCGDEISLADYLGLSFVLLGEVADFDFGPYPNIVRWIARMEARPAFAPTFAAFRGLVGFLASQKQAA